MCQCSWLRRLKKESAAPAAAPSIHLLGFARTLACMFVQTHMYVCVFVHACYSTCGATPGVALVLCMCL